LDTPPLFTYTIDIAAVISKLGELPIAGKPEMGLRAVDIQVAIQRAADADKIQQGQTAQTRAGEAGTREKAELERTKALEQPQKTERSGEVVIQKSKERNARSSGKNPESDEEQNPEPEEGAEPEKTAKPLRPDRKGYLDILA
jgi:hypothetical protein